jgi:hypothetical protein
VVPYFRYMVFQARSSDFANWRREQRTGFHRSVPHEAMFVSVRGADSAEAGILNR